MTSSGLDATEAIMTSTVLITGASSGIGRATVAWFAARGWNVAATMRSPDKAKAWPEAGNLAIFALDVTAEDSIARTVAAVVARFGRIDALVNNAGYALMGPLEGHSAAEIEAQFRTNVLGLVAATRHVLPVMRRQRSGVVINVSSIGGRLALPMASAYHATKFAVEGLSESLRFELQPFGIRVRLIEPGGIRTGFIAANIWSSHSAYTGLEASIRSVLHGLESRMPGPDSVARVIFRAATDRSMRLRYPARTGPYLALHRLLPDGMWRALLETMLARRIGFNPLKPSYSLPETPRDDGATPELR
jgi:NAD(P)-dependent dehydrogenase (short-subunit alcohol dehydrogenase family)